MKAIAIVAENAGRNAVKFTLVPVIRRGPTVVFLGKRGVGKSSTLNRLFGFDRPTDAAAECTTEPYARWISERRAGRFRIVDMPGIAAGADSLTVYGRDYRRWLRRADTVVWITQADVRAYKQDQIFFRDFSKFVRPGTRLVLALSKADTQTGSLGTPPGGTPPLDDDLFRRKALDASSKILPYTWTPERAEVVAYSVAKDWNLDALRTVVLSGAKASAATGVPDTADAIDGLPRQA